MLHPILQQLSKLRIVLGSGSPRRSEILKSAGLQFEVIPSEFEENFSIEDFKHVSEFVIETAKFKAYDLVEKFRKGKSFADLIVTADTVVMLDGEIFGKPNTKENAIKMLKRLSGKVHQVYSGVILVYSQKNTTSYDTEPQMISFHEVTDVHMCEMPEKVIECYVDTEEPLDKAGGYAIQGKGGSLVEKINGDYYNVVGFPLCRFCKELNLLLSKGYFAQEKK